MDRMKGFNRRPMQLADLDLQQVDLILLYCGGSPSDGLQPYSPAPFSSFGFTAKAIVCEYARKINPVQRGSFT
jgi:hypothetical protein